MLMRWFAIQKGNVQKRMLILVLSLVMSLNYSACRADTDIPDHASSKLLTELSTQQANRMKINIKVKDKVVTATLIDSKTTRDFVSLLPLTLWHTHPLGQTLIVTAGSGYVQQWSKPVQEIRPGDVVQIPPGVKHWHGATATTTMTHIALQESLNGKVVDWLEQVSDDQYQTPNVNP
jgi:mannose-6-phosphate isomerase-like protein (cupin superfamily)